MDERAEDHRNCNLSLPTAGLHGSQSQSAVAKLLSAPHSHQVELRLKAHVESSSPAVSQRFWHKCWLGVGVNTMSFVFVLKFNVSSICIFQLSMSTHHSFKIMEVLLHFATFKMSQLK